LGWPCIFDPPSSASWVPWITGVGYHAQCSIS
jgi:hypothetical protein